MNPILQRHANDCGIASLAFLMSVYDLDVSYESIKRACRYLGEEVERGLTFSELLNGCEELGLKPFSFKANYEKLIRETLVPFVFPRKGHFMVFFGRLVWGALVMDPKVGYRIVEESRFCEVFSNDDSGQVYALTIGEIEESLYRRKLRMGMKTALSV